MKNDLKMRSIMRLHWIVSCYGVGHLASQKRDAPNCFATNWEGEDSLFFSFFGNDCFLRVIQEHSMPECVNIYCGNGNLFPVPSLGGNMSHPQNTNLKMKTYSSLQYKMSAGYMIYDQSACFFVLVSQYHLTHSFSSEVSHSWSLSQKCSRELL